MVIKSMIYTGEYKDSILLMRVSQQLGGLDGVKQAAVVMATEANKEFLRNAGMLTEEAKSAGPNDLVVVVDAVTTERAEEVISQAKEIIERTTMGSGEEIYRTLESAIEARSDSNLVLISVPGAFAAEEAERALKLGKHVMIFSDGVALEDEIRLKRLGRDKELLVMGPDCGTSIINGIGLGFANVVRKGPVGIIAASGTGSQEVSSLISMCSGVSHVIGAGSRDLHDEVGGITMSMGLRYLAEDPGTRTIVLISKPPSMEVSKNILELAKRIGKPTVVCFLGGDHEAVEDAGLIPADTLEETAFKAVACITPFSDNLHSIRDRAHEEYRRFSPEQRYVRGIYSGGTFCYESMLLLKDLLGDVYSNTPLNPELKLEDSNRSVKHTLVDMGDDEFTAMIGKPHPMIYHELRQKRMLIEASDPETAVILLDIVLGYGADGDPAGALAPTIVDAKGEAEKKGRYLSVVASVCGTPEDPQNMDSQKEKLKGVGVVVMPSNAQATRMAALIASRGGIWDKLGGSKAGAPIELLREPKIINVGAKHFYDNLKAQGADAIHVDWRRRDKKMTDLLDRLKKL